MSAGSLRSRITLLGLCIALVATLASCGRSVEAYCEVHDKHKERYLAAMNAASGSFDSGKGLEGLVGAGVAIADLTTMWNELADVAPEEIRADTEAVAEAWEEQADRASEVLDNPLGGLAAAFGGALKMAGPLARVDAYIGENCTG